MLENVFQDLFAPTVSVDKLKSYFDTEYTQWLDGKLLTYKGFFLHVKTLKDVIVSARIEFIENDENAADIYDVFVTKKNGDKIYVRVTVFFTFKAKKLFQ